MVRIKKILVFFLMFSFMLLSACVKGEKIKNYSGKSPIVNIDPKDTLLDFNVLHNYVIDSILSQTTPFFYVKDNSFFIEGSNENKTITIKATCDNETTQHDLDLFLSLVLYYIGEGAAEQYDVFTTPNISAEGLHLDFGNVFDTYNLQFNIKLENGNILDNQYIKSGEKIPVEPKYWSEE